jgi:hypothetical protein
MDFTECAIVDESLSNKRWISAGSLKAQIFHSELFIAECGESLTRNSPVDGLDLRNLRGCVTVDLKAHSKWPLNASLEQKMAAKEAEAPHMQKCGAVNSASALQQSES